MKKKLYYTVNLQTYELGRIKCLSDYIEIRAYKMGFKRLKYFFSIIDVRHEEDPEKRIATWLKNNDYKLKNYILEKL